jgi:hypothetical protein
MKKLFTILTAIYLSANIFAQAPEKISYQAIIRDNAGFLVNSMVVGMRISILQNSPSGTPVYVETQTPTTNVNGLVSIEIGAGVTSDDFSAINWANGPYFIKTETDPAGGTSYTITGTSQLLSTPYALYAKTAEKIAGTRHYVGELYGGGIVFWVTSDGQHGLIASLADIDGGTGVQWGANDVAVTGADNMTDGAVNTADIVAALADSGTTNRAAQLCDSYTGGGFTDWYLPSNRELALLVSQDVQIDYILDNDGDGNTTGFNQENRTRYWSSTESDNLYAWAYRFGDGYFNSHGKNLLCRVRAVRAF